MPKYRLDEPICNPETKRLKRLVWLEEIEFYDDGAVYYTEKYIRKPLWWLLKLLNQSKRSPNCS